MPKTVMIVDKSLYNRMILRDILISHGYSVLEAKSGDEAIEMYEQQRPDVVTVDAAMPGIDGPRAVREIRLLNPQAAVLMCGTRGQRRLVIEGVRLGACGVLLKPFCERQMLRAISQSMGAPPPAEQ